MTDSEYGTIRSRLHDIPIWSMSGLIALLLAFFVPMGVGIEIAEWADATREFAYPVYNGYLLGYFVGVTSTYLLWRVYSRVCHYLVPALVYLDTLHWPMYSGGDGDD